jgi:hypothetical protein
MRTLPAGPALVHSLKSVTSFWRIGLRIALPWMLVIAVLQTVKLVQTPDMVQAEAPALDGFNVVMLVLGLLATSSIAVSWHRFVLRDELPANPAFFRLDRLVWRYFGYLLATVFASVVVFTVITQFLAFLVPQVFNLIVGAIFTLAFMQAAMIGLPAKALDVEGPNLFQSISLLKSNFGQIMMFAVLSIMIVLASLFVVILVATLAQQLFPARMNLIFPILALPLNIFTMLFSISAITSLYGFFVEQRDFSN